MPLPRREQDIPPEAKATPCVICGLPSGCQAWGNALCYGELDGSRMGCVTKLWREMPEGDEQTFTLAWVAKNKKARAA